jgi:hypothetical protein
MWEAGDTTWEPEANLQADLGDKMVDKMMMEMRKMQQQKMVSVMMRIDDGTVIHTRCCQTSITLCHLYKKMPPQSTMPMLSTKSDLTKNNEEVQLSVVCLQDHEVAINYQPECDSKYCRAPYFLYNVSCKGCGVKFVERLTGGSAEYKPSTKNTVYKCIGNTRGCQIAFCKNCYVKLPTNSRGS